MRRAHDIVADADVHSVGANVSCGELLCSVDGLDSTLEPFVGAALESFSQSEAYESIEKNLFYHASSDLHFVNLPAQASNDSCELFVPDDSEETSFVEDDAALSFTEGEQVLRAGRRF